jgi:ferritin-like protein
MAETKLVVDNREQLWTLLVEAVQIEHLVMCQYLYACFSLKTDPDEGLTAEQASAVARWNETVTGIAIEEMLHLALITNVMTAIGAGPTLSRPNFPRHSEYLPPGVEFALPPFGATPSPISCTWNGRRAWSGRTRHNSSRPHRRPPR